MFNTNTTIDTSTEPHISYEKEHIVRVSGRTGWDAWKVSQTMRFIHARPLDDLTDKGMDALILEGVEMADRLTAEGWTLDQFTAL